MTASTELQHPDESSVQSIPEDFILVKKQTIKMFLWTEFLVYLSQVVMFFFVAVLTSNLLRDEKQLIGYLTAKINENTVFEVIATMLAIAATMGIIAGIARAVPASSLVEKLADEVLSEAPRTAYIFGSSVTGTLLAAALFMQNHLQTEGPRPKFWLFAAFFASFIGFSYGCMFAYAFKHKAQVK